MIFKVELDLIPNRILEKIKPTERACQLLQHGREFAIGRQDEHARHSPLFGESMWTRML